MLTEVNATMYSVVVQGKTVSTNIPSRQLAEAMVFQLPVDQRAIAEIVPVTTEGKQVLFG